REFNTRSSEAWGEASRAAGADGDTVARTVANTTPFYAPDPETARAGCTRFGRRTAGSDGRRRTGAVPGPEPVEGEHQQTLGELGAFGRGLGRDRARLRHLSQVTAADVP